VSSVAISTVNGAVNPEVEMSNRVAALMGTTLTEADVHRFLLEAADLLGTESLSMYGPNVFFRWQLGERVIEIEPDYHPWGEKYSLSVDSYNRGFPIDTQERLTYKYGDAELYPYLWRVDLGGEVNDWWGPGEAYIVNWDLFEETTAKTLGGLPNDMALMPPQWRRPFTFRWDMGESGLGLVSFTGTIDGLKVTAESTGEEILIPRNLLGSERSQISMRDVVAGLAGGRALIDIRFAGSEGFGDYGVFAASPSGDEGGARQRRGGGVQLPHRGRLGDGDVVEDTEPGDDHAAGQQRLQIDVRARGQQTGGLIDVAGQVGGVGPPQGQQHGQHDAGHRSQQGGRGADGHAVGHVDGRQHHRHRSDQSHRQRVGAGQERRDHEEGEYAGGHQQAQAAEGYAAMDERRATKVLLTI